MGLRDRWYTGNIPALQSADTGLKELRYIHPNELHDVWELVRPGLELIRKRNKDEWLVEDVYAELKANQATLHIGELDSEYVGFAILKPVQAYSCRQLHVWCVYTVPGTIAVSEFEPEIENVARKNGFRKITAMSSRKGWERRFARYGYRMTQVFFEKDV